MLNLAVLNFGFHNAHHAKPGVPWHRLPALDRRLYGDDRRQERPASALLWDFHRYRLQRVFGSTAPEVPSADLGAVGVSLLTP